MFFVLLVRDISYLDLEQWVFEILFIHSPVNVIFMMEEMRSCMAGTSQRCKRRKKELKCWNASVIIIQIHSDTEKARESHICITGNAMWFPFLFEKPISTILKVIIFLWGIYSAFSCLQLCSGPVQEKTYVRQSCVVCNQHSFSSIIHLLGLQSLRKSSRIEI